VSAARARLEAALAPDLVVAIEELVAERVRAELERGRSERAWLTLEQAAERYQTTSGALRKRAQRGGLPGAIRDGARWLVEVSELDRALLGSRIASDNESGPHRANGRAHGTGGRSSHAR
jgi:hypothetical protein